MRLTDPMVLTGAPLLRMDDRTPRAAIPNLVEAFEEAKRSALHWLLDPTTSYIPVPWAADYIAEKNGLVFPDGNVWPYGVEANRSTLQAFLLYCHEQGVTARHLTPEELFPPEFAFDVVV